ncbi:MAG: hypothetical protein L0Y60_02040 [Beijerinckiaceae bacterium]|nr:hypothetical protein [Beijerinckiaceae bacterium]
MVDASNQGQSKEQDPQGGKKGVVLRTMLLDDELLHRFLETYHMSEILFGRDAV